MRPDGVVVPPPALDQHLCLAQRVEDFAVQPLITQLADEAFVLAILPGANRLDEEGLHPDLAQPTAYSLGRELRPIARTDVVGRATLHE